MTRFFCYLLLFGTSGFAGLIYESVWAQYLKLMIGHSAYAQLIVLVVFMGGMSLGAWLCAQYSKKIPNLLKTYAIIELILGIFGILFDSIFSNTNHLLQDIVLSSVQSSLTIRITLWSFGALIIFPQSILLGATFPLMTGAVLRRFPEKTDRSIAQLYFINSLGGALGVLFSGFFLIAYLGLYRTVVSAGFLNLILALVAFRLSRASETHTKSWAKMDKITLSSIWILSCSFLTGFASFLYEMGWIRMLSMVLGSSTHAFELMLSAFILGLALGSLYIYKIIHKLRSPLKTLAYIQITMGLLALLTLPTYNFSFEFLSDVLKVLPRTEMGYLLLNLFNYGLSLLLMLPTTFCAGMTLPLLTIILLKKNYGEKSIGRIYSFNTIGAIIGAIAAQQWLMPTFGLKSVIGLGVVTDIILGIGILWMVAQKKSKLSLFITGIGTFCYVIGMLGFVQLDSIKMSSGVFREGIFLDPVNTEILFLKDGKTATISVVKTEKSLTIGTNGKADGSISFNKSYVGDEPTQILLPVIPWAYNPEAKKVAVIGLGTGMSTNTLLNIPSIEQVDTIEIEPAMVEGARLFGDRVKRTFEDKRSNIIIEDARSFFNRTRNQYDLIISEPSEPWVSGVSTLFTKEFYEIVYKSLSPKGVFAQWINLYGIQPTLIASVVQALGKSFPKYVFYTTDGKNLLIIGVKDNDQKIAIDKVFLIPAIKSELAKIHVNNKDDLLIRKIGTRKELEGFFNTYGQVASSDYFQDLDLYANKSRFLKKSSNEFVEFQYDLLPLSWLMHNRESINTENITPAPYLPISNRVVRALEIYHTLVVDPKTRQLEGNYHFPLSQIENKFAFCQGEFGAQAWISSFRMIMDATIPYLSQEKMKALFDKIKPIECVEKASLSVQRWLQLYESLINRDYQDVLMQSRLLLQDNKQPALQPLLLMFSVFAELKLDKPERARELLQGYPLNAETLMQMRYLMALSYPASADKR